MGTDIHGHVEIRRFDRWHAQNNLLGLVGRSYDTFSLLFGVRGHVPFDPIAADRGLPDDLSRRVEERIDTEYRNHYTGKNLVGTVDFHSPSWVTYEELLNVDWGVKADGRDARFSVLDEDKEPTGTKFAWGSGHKELIEENRERLDNGEAVEFETTGGETRYLQRTRPTRREALSPAWEWLIFDLLDSYAERVDPEDIRLVVWFDN